MFHELVHERITILQAMVLDLHDNQPFCIGLGGCFTDLYVSVYSASMFVNCVFVNPDSIVAKRFASKFAS